MKEIFETMAQQSALLRLEVNGRETRRRVATTHIDIKAIQQFEGRRFSEVQLDGLGSLRIATFSARRALEFRKLIKRQTAGEDVELELTRLMIIGSAVDDDGKTLFDEASADAFLDKLSPEMAAKLMNEVTKLQGESVPVGNPSSASPSAA